jgi:NADH dehydrogenase
MATICVLGGTGFIGHHLLNRLSTRGDKAVVPTRRRAHGRDLYLLPAADFIEADVHDDAQLARLVRGADAVVNLIGILYSPPARSGAPYGALFDKVHVQLPKRLGALCAREGVEHVVQVSALGAAPDAPSEYLRSKAAGEKALTSTEGICTTVFRPSVVFGREDRFTNVFAELQRLSPVVLLPCPNARFQPVLVEDVATCIARSLLNPACYGKSYDLCGPRIYTLREIVEFTGRASGHPRPVIGLPGSLGALQAGLLERLPGRLMTRDNVRSMQVESTSSAALPFGVQPTSLEAAAPAWLAGGSRVRISSWRSRAGR